MSTVTFKTLSVPIEEEKVEKFINHLELVLNLWTTDKEQVKYNYKVED